MDRDLNAAIKILLGMQSVRNAMEAPSFGAGSVSMAISNSSIVAK